MGPGLEEGRRQGAWIPGDEGSRKRDGLLRSREEGAGSQDPGFPREEGLGQGLLSL